MASPAIAIRMVRAVPRQRLLARYRDALDEIKRALSVQVKKRAVGYADDIVNNWDNKPKFVASIFSELNRIRLYVEPVGPNAKYWDWTSRGTKPHMITAGTRIAGGIKKNLLFRQNYMPKTMPGPTWGGAGTSSGPWIAKRIVHHPGTKPRKFEEWIGRQIKSEFRREIENAFRRGMRRAAR